MFVQRNGVYMANRDYEYGKNLGKYLHPPKDKGFAKPVVKPPIEILQYSKSEESGMWMG